MSFISPVLRFILRKPPEPHLEDKFGKVQTLYYKGQFSNVRETLSKVVFEEENEFLQNFLENYSHIFVAKSLIAEGDTDGAKNELDKVNQENENSHPLTPYFYQLELSNMYHSTGDLNQSLELLNNVEEKIVEIKFLYPSNYKTILTHTFGLKAKLLRKKAEIENAINYLNQAIELNNKMNDQNANAELYNDLGISFASIGKTEDGLKYLMESRSIYETLENDLQLLKIINNVGMINRSIGNLELAVKELQTALDLSNKLGIEVYSASMLLNLGLIEMELGNIEESRSNLEGALDIYEKLSNKRNIAITQSNLANLHQLTGDLIKSMDYYSRSLKNLKEIDAKNEIGIVSSDMAALYAKMDNKERSRELYEESIKVFEETGDERAIIQALYGIIVVLVELNDIETANLNLAKLEQIYNSSPTKIAEHNFLMSKASILLSSDRVVQRAEAQKILADIADDEVATSELTVDALLKLGDLLLQELKLSPSEEALNEFKELINRLDKFTRASGEGDIYQVPTLVQVLFLQSKLALIDLEIEKSDKLLDEAYNLAKSKRLLSMADAIKAEKEANKNQMMKYKKMMDENASLVERLQQTQIESYLKKAESILKK